MHRTWKRCGLGHRTVKGSFITHEKGCACQPCVLRGTLLAKLVEVPNVLIGAEHKRGTSEQDVTLNVLLRRL